MPAYFYRTTKQGEGKESSEAGNTIALAAGMDDYPSKPVEPDELKAMMENYSGSPEAAIAI